MEEFLVEGNEHCVISRCVFSAGVAHPALHEQVKEPLVMMHEAFKPQLLTPFHSFTSLQVPIHLVWPGTSSQPDEPT